LHLSHRHLQAATNPLDQLPIHHQIQLSGDRPL
jgi:hypothetical protein